MTEKQMDNSTWYQAGMLLSGLLAGGGLTAKLMGKKREGCQDATCHSKVTNHGKQITELRKNIDTDIFPKINKTAEDVQFIRGWIEGQQK
jgi:hypothetical protein